MSRLPDLTHVNRKAEQKALWNRRERKTTSVLYAGKKTDQKKKQKKKQISKPLAVGSAAHGDRK